MNCLDAFFAELDRDLYRVRRLRSIESTVWSTCCEHHNRVCWADANGCLEHQREASEPAQPVQAEPEDHSLAEVYERGYRWLK